MKNIIYFFSATGNSLKMAKELAQRLETTEIVQMRQELLNETLRVDADHIGFIFPTIFSGIPKLVDNVIRLLQITSPAPYIYMQLQHVEKRMAPVLSLNKLTAY